MMNMACSDAAACKDRLDSTFEVDHTEPLWAGGEDNVTNCTAMCPRCHKLKTAAESTEAAQIRRGETTGVYTQAENRQYQKGHIEDTVSPSEQLLDKAVRSYSAALGHFDEALQCCQQKDQIWEACKKNVEVEENLRANLREMGWGPDPDGTGGPSLNMQRRDRFTQQPPEGYPGAPVPYGAPPQQPTSRGAPPPQWYGGAPPPKGPPPGAPPSGQSRPGLGAPPPGPHG
eukprot:CAMPEP_0198683938 /NCGR_PEP_ID=MMETSP1468-20131203/11442_1 /TAXON_ID=1461545 /ORGANISM="Mantoniella sp, Strain CCMP1436" /LENGTH=229 /DNA_ID=CAMNT_0044428373 /DNA_START=327 /DNA_END=1011 /DNA_ORIENTATION=-